MSDAFFITKYILTTHYSLLTIDDSRSPPHSTLWNLTLNIIDPPAALSVKNISLSVILDFLILPKGKKQVHLTTPFTSNIAI